MKRDIVTRNGTTRREPVALLDDGWFRENGLLIENASPEAIQEIFEFSVVRLVQSILNVCFPNAKDPVKFMGPERMQRFLESLSVPDYKETALRLGHYGKERIAAFAGLLFRRVNRDRFGDWESLGEENAPGLTAGSPFSWMAEPRFTLHR